ncbi:MAG: DNA topoisomerase VI subunit B [Acidobacteriota bacterium]
MSTKRARDVAITTVKADNETKAGAATSESSTAESAAATGQSPARRASAAELATRQREISISEFFTKNRHLLGFDNPQKALLTTVKEAVDNSLDACEEAGILPDILVDIEQLAEDRFRVIIEDNGPGIVKAQVPKIFGKLLYGSKFHAMRQSRGQQGIGISAAGMYGQLTTGKSIIITSRTGPRKEAHHIELVLDMRKNEPKILKDTVVTWDQPHGTRVELELQGTYRKGARSVDEYISQTAVANPHARIRYKAPKSEIQVFERAVEQLPPHPAEIKPHPYGVELGMLIKMMHETKSTHLKVALQTDFSRVSTKVADEICKLAGISPKAAPRALTPAQIEGLHRTISQVKIMAPPTNCIVPIGEEQILAGLKQQFQAEFFTAITRPPAVYRGNPFQIEVGLAYGGQLPGDGLINILRFANRVPLLYQQSACATFKAIISVEWRNYNVQQSRGALPSGPIVAFVHIASVWVPFTSESKEAIASYPEILKEMRLALQEAARRLSAFIRRGHRLAEEHKKRSYIEKYIPVIGESLQNILTLNDRQRERATAALVDILERSRKN